MKVRLFLFGFWAVFVLSCTPATFTVAPGPIKEAYKPVECPSLPFALDIHVKEEETASDFLAKENVIYSFQSGKYLKQLSSLYLRPCLDRGPEKEEALPFVSLSTGDLKVKRVAGPSLLSSDRIRVEVDLDVHVFYDLVVLYRFSVSGSGEAPVSILGSESARKAAEQAYAEAIRKIPPKLAEVLSDLKRSKTVKEREIEAKLKLGQPPSQLHGDFVALANLCRLIKAYPEALSAAKRVIEADPKDCAAYEALALTYMDKGDWREAEKSLKKALEIDPKRNVATVLLGRLYLKSERYEEAAQALSRVGSFKGLPSLHMGRFKEAADYDTQFLNDSITTGIGVRIDKSEDHVFITEVMPSSPAEKAGLMPGDEILGVNGQSVRGFEPTKVLEALRGEEGSEVSLLVKRSGWDKPQHIKVKRERIATSRLVPWVLSRRALAFRALGKKEEFIKDAEAAYKLNPRSKWAKSVMAIALMDMGRPLEALGLLEDVAEDPFTGLLKGIAYARLGDMRKASEVYAELPEELHYTQSALFRGYLSDLQAHLKPYKEALLKEAKAQEGKGLYKDAIRGYAEYLKLADQKEAKELRSYIADLMAKQPHLFALPEEARRAVIRAEAYASEGKLEKAIEEYKEALKLSPFFPGLYKALAYSYAQLKDYRKAIRNLEIYLELYPDAPDARAAKDELYRWEFMMQRGD